MNKQSQQSTDNRQRSLSKIFRKLIVRGFWFVALVMLVCSCSSNKDITKSNLRSYSANHIIREIEDNRFEFDNLETKLDIKVKGDNKLGLKGQLRMQNDSVIWVSLSLKLGIEVARVMITEDSLKFINRTEKTYFTASLDNVKNIFPIDASISFLQDILVGNNSQLKRSDKYKVVTDKGRYKLESNKNELIRKDIWVNPKEFRISQYDMKSFIDGNSVSLRYDNFQEVEGRLLPTKIIIETSDNLGIDIEIDYSDIKAGEELAFPFNISKKYSKIKW